MPYNIRITPAHAGTTPSLHRVPCLSLDHPRSRGDHALLPMAVARHPGSPPLTRGPPLKNGVHTSYSWITPAHAGTTPRCPPGLAPARDHPRSRGDHPDETARIDVMLGSPPLTRGPLPLRLCPLQYLRITPAHAGTTGNEKTRSATRGDHPRSRGDHANWSFTPRTERGSPPLTRGPLGRVVIAILHSRITPAHAGTTGCTSGPTRCRTDHPRSRGDH